MMETDKPDFETVLMQLEQLVSRLENGELSLEESLRDFEKGIKLVNLGQQHLTNAEQRIKILLEKDPDAALVDYTQ